MNVNMMCETGTSGTFTFVRAYCIWTSRDDILRNNVKRIWASLGLIMMLAVPIGIMIIDYWRII